MPQKDKRIKDIVSHLKHQLGSENIILSDHWEGDNCAIGLTGKQNNNLVYISTYNKKENEYYVELEYPAENRSAIFKNGESYDNAGVDKVEAIVRKHLEIE